YEAPVHFIYKFDKENEKLTLDRRHVITKNILSNKKSNKAAHEENPQEKEYIKNFEHQLQNLEKKMDMDEIFYEQGVSAHAIGNCEHIPLFEKEGDFWGIYCVGPFAKSPEQIIPKLSIVGRILSSWLISLDEQESNPQKDYRERVDAIVTDLGSGRLNTNAISDIILRYMVHHRKAEIGAVVECTSSNSVLIASVGLSKEESTTLSGKGEKAVCLLDGERPYLTSYGKEWIKKLNKEVEAFAFIGEQHQGMVFIQKTEISSKLNEERPDEVIKSFGTLLDYRKENEAFTDQLCETYYQMLRTLEQYREKTTFHTPRMIAFVQRFGMMFGLEDEEMEIITQTAKLHDIGYVGALSVEPGKTIGGEIEHPVIGADLVRQLAVDEIVIEGIKTHHEWVNGNGTPSGLNTEEIPWTGKIICLFEYVVDFVETYQNDSSKTDEEWMKMLSKGMMERADNQFDMVLVPTAIQLIQALGWQGCKQLGTKR
ncbi:MAG: HD domain-containing phosphohydrolase, partial [Gracilimonas sp.]|nr:HD domain-containing phosphohydrolase [Gracilimonas sp.]